MVAENDSVSLKEKGMVLYACLTLSGVSIQEAAEHFLDEYDDASSQTVSMVLRSYGFNDKDLGRFVRLYSFAFKRSRYSKIDVNIFKQQDLAAFVREHPNGGTTPEEMEKFLRARINERLLQQRSDNPISQPKQKEHQQSEEPRRIVRQTAPLQQPEKPAYTAPEPVKSTPDKAEPNDRSAERGSEEENPENNVRKAQSAASKKKWGGIVGAFIGIIAVLFIFNSACGGNTITCVSSSGRTGCVSSGSINVEINAGYITNGSFDNASLVVDDKYRILLEVSSSNKFTASMDRGKHTVRVEYYQNGTLYSTNSLDINVSAADNHFNVLVYPLNGKLTLTLSDI